MCMFNFRPVVSVPPPPNPENRLTLLHVAEVTSNTSKKHASTTEKSTRDVVVERTTTREDTVLNYLKREQDYKSEVVDIWNSIPESVFESPSIKTRKPYRQTLEETTH